MDVGEGIGKPLIKNRNLNLGGGGGGGGVGLFVFWVGLQLISSASYPRGGRG